MAGKPQDADKRMQALDRLAGVSQGKGSSLWSSVDRVVLLEMLTAVTAQGDALVLSITSDGGAMAITVLSGSVKRRFYEHEGDAMDEVMRRITEWAES